MTVIRRYRMDNGLLEYMQRAAAKNSVEAVSAPWPSVMRDVSLDELVAGYAANADEAMALMGFVFVSQDPAGALEEAAFAAVPLVDKAVLFDHGNVGAAVTIDLGGALWQKITLTGSLGTDDITLTLPPGPVRKPRSIKLEIAQGGAGAFLIPAAAWQAAPSAGDGLAGFGSKGAPVFGEATGESRFLVLDYRGAGDAVFVHYDTNVFG